MNDHASKPERLAELRIRAASRLVGPASRNGAFSSAADALAVLHMLAASPDTAADALALLHELQVHQVELEMQAQELQESRAELESALRRQIELYDFQPVGCFTVDASLVLQELNLTGARMLGIERDEAFGMGLEAFFCPESRGRLKSAIEQADAGVPPAACPMTLCAGMGRERTVMASVGLDPATRRYFVSLADAGGEQGNRLGTP
jgi:PAS domain-containing protein